MTTTSMPETRLVGGRPLRVLQHGDGPPLLLLNGVGAPLELWWPLLRRLDGVRAVAVDLPGGGGTALPYLPMSVRGLAELAADLLDSLGIDEVCVLGYSFGGMVAQELARLAGARVERLVLVSTSCGWGGVPGSLPALLAMIEADGNYSRILAAEPERRWTSRPVRPDRATYVNHLWAAGTWSSALWLHELGQPALVVTGDVDPIVPAVNATILTALLPAARLHVVDGGGHLCLLERAADVAPVLRDFLG